MEPTISKVPVRRARRVCADRALAHRPPEAGQRRFKVGDGSAEVGGARAPARHRSAEVSGGAIRLQVLQRLPHHVAQGFGGRYAALAAVAIEAFIKRVAVTAFYAGHKIGLAAIPVDGACSTPAIRVLAHQPPEPRQRGFKFGDGLGELCCVRTPRHHHQSLLYSVTSCEPWARRSPVAEACFPSSALDHAIDELRPSRPTTVRASPRRPPTCWPSAGCATEIAPRSGTSPPPRGP